MCGRYAVLGNEDLLIEAFNIEEFTVGIEPNFNVAPGQNIYAILNSNKRLKLGTLKWGLIPYWAKDDSLASKMINARSETIQEKPSFRASFKKKRCLIPAIGYYEWKVGKEAKIPYFITFRDKRLFAMAGIWESWLNPKTQKKVFTTSILTTDANLLTASVHHRMPVIIGKKDYNKWLDPNFADYDYLLTLFKAKESDDLILYPVTKEVNNVKNNQSYLIEPESRT